MVDLGIGLAHHGAEGALVELALGVGPPGLGDGAVGAAHGGFKLLLLDDLGEPVSELNLLAAVDEVHVGEAELELDVAVKLDEVADGEEDVLEAVLDNILAHVAALGDGHGVGVDHAEALLEDRALGVGGVDLLLVGVTDQVGEDVLIGYEAGSITVASYKTKSFTSGGGCACARHAGSRCRRRG